MAITLLSSTFAQPGTGGGSTSPINTTGATLLVVAICDLQGTGTVTDSAGNYWRPLTVWTAPANSHFRFFYAVLPKTSATHTFTYSVGASYPTIFAMAFSGAGAFDKDTGNSNSSTSVTIGSTTPSQANSLLISGVTLDASNTGETISGGGLALLSYQDYSPGASMGGGVAYEVQTVATARSPKWGTSAGAINRAAALAVFAPLPSSGGGTTVINRITNMFVTADDYEGGM